MESRSVPISAPPNIASSLQEARSNNDYTSTKHAHFAGMSGPALRAAIGLTAGLSFVAFGYGQGDIGGLFIVESFERMFSEFYVPLIGGAVVGTWNLGCLTGAALLIFLSNTLGRKGSMVSGLLLEIVGRIIQTATFTPGQYIAGRFVAGLGNGFIASAVPAWYAECLKTHRRGSMLMVSFGVCVTAGIACAFWTTYGFSWVGPNSASWRVPLALPIVFLLPALLLLVYLPESPRYLILTGRENAALEVLSALNEMPPTHEDTRREYLLIKNAIMHMLQGSDVSSLFSMGKSRYRHRVILAISLQVMQQFTGVNLFVQYLATMFWEQLGFAQKLAGLLGACCSTTFCVASILALLGMDRFWGRRGLTMFGSAGMMVSLIVLAVMAYLATETSHLVMAVFFFTFCTFFSVGWQGMSWLWAIELIPLPVRGPANALATTANWLSNWIVVFCNPLLLTRLTWKTYILFGVCNFISIPIIYVFLPDTGSRSLEEIDLLFQSATEAGRPWFSVVEISKKEPRWFDRTGAPTTSEGSTTLAESEKGFATKFAKPVESSAWSSSDGDWSRRES